MERDEYMTVVGDSRAQLREMNSRFISFCFHVESEDEVRSRLEPIRKEYYDATHHCYAYRLTPTGELWRMNDDGEPSSTAGKPIFGQILSRNLTDTLVVVVRYFGGTKLGVPGLIDAYRRSAQSVLDASRTEIRTVDDEISVTCPYDQLNGVMRVMKTFSPKVLEQTFDNMCSIRLAVRQSLSEPVQSSLGKVPGARVTLLGHTRK